MEFHLSEANGLFKDAVAEYTAAIVPRDYDPADPVCSGPFKLKSFTPAQSAVLVPNEYYLDADKIYLDEVQLLNFNDSDALINALLSTQVDAIAQIPLALVEVIGADERMAILNSETGMWLPFTMRVDKAALRRRQGATGIPPRRRPGTDDRAGPLRLRHRRQRHVRAPERELSPSSHSASRTFRKPRSSSPRRATPMVSTSSW